MSIVRGSIACALALVLVAGIQDSPSRAAGAAGGGVETVDQARIENADMEPGNWMSHGRTYKEERYSPLTQIDRANVGKVGLAWVYETREGRVAESTPVVVDGVMYVTSAWSVVYALDARTGKELWVYDPKVDRTYGGWACCDVVNRGVAVWKGRVYVGTFDGRLVAINAKDGTKAWDVLTFDPKWPYTMTGAPRVAKGMVFIGNGGAEYGVRGHITAYDAETGAMKWRFYTVPGDPSKGPDHAASDPQMAMMAKTWSGKYWRQGGGGTVWDAIVYDAELDQLYFGVGNGSPWNRYYRSEGKGDNLLLTSIVAVKPETGEYLWHFQETAGEQWDYTATQPIILSTLKINGVDRKVLMQAPKNGFFYVLDRTNGKFISGKNFVPMAKASDTPKGTPVSWAYGLDENGRALENPEARYPNGPQLVSPSGVGAHNWYPMSYSPQTGLVYFGARSSFFRYSSDPKYVYKDHLRSTGVPVFKQTYQYSNDMAMPGEAADLSKYAKGSLVAWDPVAQKEVWSVPVGAGGTLATAGGLVFASESARVSAYNARDGKKLWDADTVMGISNPPITYAVDGVQYVAVMTSAGGAAARTPGLMPKSRVLVYKLGGAAALPAYPKPEPMAAPPVIKASTTDLAQGEKLYTQSCQLCHGGNAASGGSYPDLRRTPYIQDQAAFLSVLHGGLAANGMPDFTKWIKPQDAALIRAYIVTQAQKLYTAQNQPKGN
ncbi:MAG: PQQ-dependent dehydrogenase, methanol/ethanol family [Rhodospirillaceae bacterium]